MREFWRFSLSALDPGKIARIDAAVPGKISQRDTKTFPMCPEELPKRGYWRLRLNQRLPSCEPLSHTANYVAKRTISHNSARLSSARDHPAPWRDRYGTPAPASARWMPTR